MSTPVRTSLRLYEKQRNAQASKPATLNNKRQSSDATTSKASPSKRRKTLNAPEADGSEEPRVARPDGRVKGRRGHLQLMTEMPMDVLFEILSSLEPIDLLHLSWASKALHSIVMGKSARYLWERAFEALCASPHPPPQCPSDITLAQYTKLLFDKRCMECNSPHGSHVIWPHRLRVCANCLEGSRFTVLTSPYRYWMVIPMIRTFVHGRYQTFVLASEFDEIKAKMDTMNPNGAELREFTKQRGEWVTTRRQDEWKFSQWQREQKRDRKNELEDIRIKRRAVIVDKLCELGWRDEIERLTGHQLWTLPGMRIAKPLTDKAWETLCPELIDHLEAVKALRFERERQDRITRRCELLAQKIAAWVPKQSQLDALPQILDFAISEPFKSFILSESDEEPVFITDDTEFLSATNTFLEEWNGSRDQFLISLFPASNKGSRANAKGKDKAVDGSYVLNLATTFFQCPACVEPISYPRALAHECLRSSCTQSNRRDDDPEDLAVLSAGISYCRPWLCDAKDLIFDQEASDVAKMIVLECGGNPAETTAQQMDEMNPRLECLRCTEPKKGRSVMKWRMAVSVIFHPRPRPETDNFRIDCPRAREAREQDAIYILPEREEENQSTL
ncbi:hypothetical protein AN958_00772 [Leucoagaricus sp. SymC.cos]|nr:hypothetical protein AN958_00772 [Leucoagaricus sp. SymC.cos]